MAAHASTQLRLFIPLHAVIALQPLTPRFSYLSFIETGPASSAGSTSSAVRSRPPGPLLNWQCWAAQGCLIGPSGVPVGQNKPLSRCAPEPQHRIGFRRCFHTDASPHLCECVGVLIVLKRRRIRKVRLCANSDGLESV